MKKGGCHSGHNVALYWVQLVYICKQTIQSKAIWDGVIFQGHIIHSFSAESNQEWIGHCCQCQRSSFKFGQIKLISPRFQNGFRGVGRHLVFLLLPNWTNLLTQPKQLFTFWDTDSGSLWAWNQSYAYFALPQCLYLYSFETAQNRGTLSAYGWQNKVDRLEDSYWPPRDPSLCSYWRSPHFVSTHIAEGASQNFVQKGIFSWAEFP